MSAKSHKFNRFKSRGRKGRRTREWLQEESKKRIAGGNGKIDVGFWNVRNLVTLEKQEIVHDLIDQSGIDILCLSETWFREDSKEHGFSHKGYNAVRNERSGNNRKGDGNSN